MYNIYMKKIKTHLIFFIKVGSYLEIFVSFSVINGSDKNPDVFRMEMA